MVIVDGMNRSLQEYLQCIINGNDTRYTEWSADVKLFPLSYNSQITTTLGMSPYEMVLNQKPRKPIMFTANAHKNTHRNYRFQLILINFPNLHIIWTAGKNLALPDTLSRNTPPELLTRTTTVEIPQNIKFYLAKNETSPRLECKYAVKTDIDQSQINNLQHFPLYLDCQNNHYEVDFINTSTFKPFLDSHWIKK